MCAKNDYEQAFEQWLQEHKIAFQRLNQHHRAIFSDRPLKTFDYIVYPPALPATLVELKGKRFTKERFAAQPDLQHWVFYEDVISLARWQDIFSQTVEPVDAQFVFAYRFDLPVVETHQIEVFYWQGYRYAFLAIDCRIYQQHCVRRSSRWGTVDCKGTIFAQFAQPASKKWQLKEYFAGEQFYWD